MALTAQQQERRRQTLGASEVAAVLGLDKYRTAGDVYLEKRGLVEPFIGNDFTYWGEKLETPIAEWAADQLKDSLIRPAASELPIIHPSEDWASSSPDFFLGRRSDALLEIKNVGLRRAHEWGESETDKAPARVIVQVHWQMWTTGKREAFVGALIGGNDSRLIRMAYDEELVGMMVGRAKPFWFDCVQAGESPEPDGNPAWSEYFAERFPREERDLLTSSPELDEIAEKLLDVRRQIDVLEAEKTLHENRLKAAIGDHAGLVGPWGRVSWKANSAGNVQWKKVAEAMKAPAEVVEAHRGKAPRPFTITPAADRAAAQQAA